MREPAGRARLEVDQIIRHTPFVGEAETPFWVRWHDDYDDPQSDLAQRLSAVQKRLRQAIDAAPAGPVRLISLCAGQGRDAIGSLRDHPRAADVSALLVELDEHNVAVAREAAAAAGLTGIEIVQGDASLTGFYRDAVPADVLLLCGIFGNISSDDVHALIESASRLCAPNATVIWTQHRRSPDGTPATRGWFAGAGFDEVAFDSPGKDRFSVGTWRLRAEPLPFQDDLPLFRFLERGESAPGG